MDKQNKVSSHKENKTPSTRKQAQILASENRTLVGSLLNGSLVVWLFIFMMLGTAVNLWQDNEDKWLDIEASESGIQEIQFNEDAYDIDYSTYNNIGNMIIGNFENSSFIFEQGSAILQGLSGLIDSVGNYFGGDNWFVDGVARFFRWIEPLFIWNW
jgi:hypothetical protein